MTILVLQPVNPVHQTARRADGVSLDAVAAQLLARLPAANPGMAFDIRRDATAIPAPPSPSRYARHAAVRNYMLDTYLRPEHTQVLWIDSDLVDYPADLPTQLADAEAVCTVCGTSEYSVRITLDAYDCGTCGNAWASSSITAPLVLLDQCGARFYDIGGFIEGGRRFPLMPPYSLQDGPCWALDSVGCCYLAPAWLYQAGVRYSPPPTDYYVEHWSVMTEARARGVRIVAVPGLVARHAYLPEYGLPLN